MASMTELYYRFARQFDCLVLRGHNRKARKLNDRWMAWMLKNAPLRQNLWVSMPDPK